MFSCVTHFEIGDRHESDHFPLICYMSFNTVHLDNNNGNAENDHNLDHNFNRYKWDEGKKEMFLINFRTVFMKMKASIVENINVDINVAIDKIKNVYQNAANRMKVRPFVKHDKILSTRLVGYRL